MKKSVQVVVSGDGLTLVELLIVVVILAIVLTIVIHQFSVVSTDTTEVNLDRNLTQMRAAIEIYRQEHGYYPGEADSKGATCPNGGIAGTGKGGKGAKRSFAEQLTMYTNRAGQACSTTDAAFKFGPYLRSTVFGEDGLPKNPITNENKLKVVHDGSLNMTSTSTKGGWKYDRFSGKLIADHEDFDNR